MTGKRELLTGTASGPEVGTGLTPLRQNWTEFSCEDPAMFITDAFDGQRSLGSFSR